MLKKTKEPKVREKKYKKLRVYDFTDVHDIVHERWCLDRN